MSLPKLLAHSLGLDRAKSVDPSDSVVTDKLTN